VTPATVVAAAVVAVAAAQGMNLFMHFLFIALPSLLFDFVQSIVPLFDSVHKKS